MKIKIIALSVVIVLSLMVIPVSDSASADESLTGEEVHDAVYFQSGDTPDMDGYNLAVEQDIDVDNFWCGEWYGVEYELENAISLDVDVIDTNSMEINGTDHTEIKVRVTADAYAEGVVTPGIHNYNGYGINLAGEFTSEDPNADECKLHVLTGYNHGTNTIGDNWYEQEEGDEPSLDVKDFFEEAAWTFADEVSPVPISWASIVYEDVDASRTNLKGDATDFGEEAFIEFQNEIEESITDSTYQASTVFEFDMPHDAEGYTLHLSAQNLIGARLDGGSLQNIHESAEASVEIPIKNAEIEEIESENKDSDPHISGENFASLDDEITMKFELTPSGTFVAQEEKVPPPEAPKVDLTVDWGASQEEEIVKEGWKPYHWEYAGYGQEPDGYYEGDLSEEDIQVNSDQYGNGDELNMPHFHWYERVDDEATPLHVYEDLEGLGLDEGEEMGITVEITVEVLDEYGGWEESIGYEVTIEREEDDNGGGGGGGGDPPPNLPSGDDT